MQENSKILLVEDEESLAIGLDYNLSAEGYQVTWVADGREALKKFETEEYDLVILDIMLPYVDGFEVAEKIRSKDPQLPVLMLTARTGIKDRVKGLHGKAVPSG
jgi:DNA-binding response OmpR family regulator